MAGAQRGGEERRLRSLIPCSAVYSIAASRSCCLAVLPLTLMDCTVWYMKPVRVSIDVPQAREDVYDFLDVLANHELFTDHMMRDWRYEGPARGVGAKAKVTAVAVGRTDTLDMEVIEAERPTRNVERNVGASGRVLTGTYTLAGLPGGGTRITFESVWLRVPRSEALAAPLVRAVVRRGNKRAMERLAEQLRDHKAGDASG